MDPEYAGPARTATRAPMPQLGRNARLLLAFALVNGAATAAVGALVNPYLRDLGMSAAFIGAYFGITSVVQGVAQLAGGVAADRWGRRRVWVTGKLLHTASYALLASGLRGPALIASAVLAGLSQIGSGAYMATTAEAVEGGSRATFYSVVQTITSVGGMVAPLAGGLIADRYGGATGLAASLPFFLLVAFILSKLEERPRPSAAGEASAGRRGAARGAGAAKIAGAFVKAVMSGPFPRTAMAMLGYMVFNGLSNGLIGISLPLLLRDRFGAGYAGISGLSTVSALGTALMMIAGGRLADRYGRRRVMLASCVWVTSLFLLIPLATSTLHFYVLVFMVCLVGNAAGGAFSATMMECVNPDARATFGGLSNALASAGMAAGNFAGGLLYQAGQLAPFYLAMAVTAASTAILFGFLQETGDGRAAAKAVAAGAYTAGR
ncbi:MAG: MFS transporter [Bacillota bacterium]|nr:MFS transporter [Bacillota bacterium]